jgi:hypothetical protein
METLSEGTVQSLPIATWQPGVDWFWGHGCVVEREGAKQVFIGGALMGQFDVADRDRGPRNVLLVTLAKEPTMHFGHLARAFGVGEEYLRRLRRLEEREGLVAVLKPAMGCAKRDLDPKKRRELRKLFEAGWNASDATRRQRGKRVSRATVQRERRRWLAEQQSEAIAAPVAAAITEVITEQLDLFSSLSAADGVATTTKEASAALQLAPDAVEVTVVSEVAAVSAAAVRSEVAAVSEVVTDEPAPSNTEEAGEALAAADERDGVVSLRSRPVIGGGLVQHAGTWLMMSLAQRDGLHDEVTELGGGDSERIAIDATLASLAIGERTVEGVRRLATPTGPHLLRTDRSPTANTVRRRLWQFANDHGATLMARMGQRYIEAARGGADAPAVFYIDNHLRPYCGEEIIRKGWRMQDRRVLPGTTDYYVHDEDGRPMFRVDVPSHDSLSQWLMPIAARLREALGCDERILLAFDRAGSYADDMVALRDGGFEFVAYERKPFALLSDTAFDQTIQIRSTTYGLHEDRMKNLGRARGRVRRISLRTPEGAQINILCISQLPAAALVGILLGRAGKDDPSGRWVQENGFKRGVERWGINQLDGRKVEPVPPGTIIPNPRRRRIERALTIARADEGRARCALAALAPDDARRERVAADLAEAIQRRVQLELMRPLVPKHAPVENTELAGKLVRHTGQLKAVIDTLRIVSANIEADLADIIAPHMRRPKEAKKMIANLFAAPGRVDVTSSEIRVRLAPAANRSERAAIRRLLSQVSALQLMLPGDSKQRPLRFELQPL